MTDISLNDYIQIGLLIIAIISILSPIIVSIINNIYNYNVKKLDMYELQKREILQNFINVAIECFKYDNDWRQNKEFVKSLYSLQLYFKSADDKLIKEINQAMENYSDKNKFQTSFVIVISRLSKEIKKK